MNAGTRIYKNYSICDCGFPALNESVPLGKSYEVDEESVKGGFTFICGGCRKVHPDVKVICARDDRGEYRPLPLAVFEPPKGH